MITSEKHIDAIICIGGLSRRGRKVIIRKSSRPPHDDIVNFGPCEKSIIKDLKTNSY